MKTICRNKKTPWPAYKNWGKCLIGLTFVTIVSIFLTTSTGIAGKEENSKVDIRNYCIQSRQDQCKAGMPVLEKLIINMGAFNDGTFALWDAKPSEILNKFWHFIYTDVTGQRVVIYSDGENMVPVVFPVVPGRDIGNITDEQLKKNPKLKRLVENERIRRESGREDVSFENRIPLEQNGMYLGRLDVRKLVEEKKAFEIVKGRKGYGYALVADNLFQPDMVDILDGIRQKKEKYEKYFGKTIYFSPTFSFMGNVRTALIGKYFYALVENGMKPGHAVYALAKLSPTGKVNPPALKEYCLSLVGKKKKKEFLKSLTSVNFDYPIQGALMDLGIAAPQYHIINGQLFHGI